MAEKIHGIFTPHVVPLQPNGEINEPELRRYIDWLIAKGVHGLYPNGSTGEFTRFTAEERKRIVKIVCDQAAGRVPVLAGAAEANVRETLRPARPTPARRAGGGHRLAVLLQALPRVGLRLFPRDRPEQPDRRDALQHPDVRQSDRRAHHPAAGRIRSDRRHQGFVGRHGLHDADDRLGAAGSARLRLPDRLGRGAGADAADRLRRRHQRQRRRRPRVDAQALRPGPRRADRRGDAIAVPHSGTVRHDALLGRLSRGIPGGR